MTGREQPVERRPCPAPEVEQHLERPVVAQESTGEGGQAADPPERDDFHAHAHRLDLGASPSRWRTEHEGAAGDRVAGRQEAEVMVGADLIAAPGRHRKTRGEEEYPHSGSQRLVLAACRQTPSVCPRR